MVIKGFTLNCGGEIVPGIMYMMYMVSKCDVESFPALKTTSGIGDKITLDGDIVLKAGKTWAKVAIISNTGRIKHNGVGSITSKAFDNALDFKLPTDLASDEWINDNQNFEGIVLVREKVGQYRVFGNLDNQAFFETTTTDRGASNADESSWSATIKDEVGAVAPYYEGVITTEIALGDFNNDFNNDFN